MRNTAQEQIIFVTGNIEKFQIAHAVCDKQGITLIQKFTDIDEIQSEDIEAVARDKAQRAFTALQHPLVINDAAWTIPALRGFPGPYMKSINYWFQPEDWLQLMKPYEDRRIILTELLVYQDELGSNLFRKEFVGTILQEAHGAYGNSLHKVISMPGDYGRTVAEVYDKGVKHDEREVSVSWLNFLDWYMDRSNTLNPSLDSSQQR